MNDNIAVVHQDPAAGRFALRAEKMATPLRQRVVNMIPDRPDLSLGIGRANHEIVRDRRQSPDLEHDQIGRLFFQSGLGSPQTFFSRIDCRCSDEP